MATQRIRVAARIRPLLAGEIDDDYLQVFGAADKSSSSTNSGTSCIITKNQGSDWSKFPFTSCYDASSTQEEIFQNDVQPLIDVIYSGIIVTVFAYGVTSSGKTHTMQGSKEQPGIIPRTVRALFDKKSEISQFDISFSLSYMEIYKDEVYDLLVPRDTAQKLPVREDGAGVVFVANLTWKPISSVSEFDGIYSKASKQRSVGSTKLNNSSSRSHAILSLQVSMFDVENDKTITGKILLVDLAGSENNKLTGNDPSRMAESSAINRSLSVLGQVVRALNAGHTRIPYRDSKLTRILQPALGGNSLGLLICNLAPGTKLKKDTLNTLNFASTAVNIENKPTVHEASNAPQAKPHFAALNVYPRKSVVLQSAASNIFNRPSVGSRPSLVPRFSRLSSLQNFQPFSFAAAVKENSNSASREGNSQGSTGLSEKEIDERISKAVEAEVERRLAEREKERQREEEDRRQREAAESSTSVPSLPSGVLTPLIKRHHDLDEELKGRLKELEDKYLKEEKDVYAADNLSPVSRKKAGRAYVALARTYSTKGELGSALELYRRAELYVPDNIKLKERIIDLEYSVKNGTEFVPSPKKPKKDKTKNKKKKRDREPEQGGIMSDEQMEIDEVARTLAQGPLEFDEDNDAKMETPIKKRIRDEADSAPSSKRRRGLDGTPVVGEEEMPRMRRSPRKRVLI